MGQVASLPTGFELANTTAPHVEFGHTGAPYKAEPSLRMERLSPDGMSSVNAV